jgi:hypothetical protein
MPRDCIPAQPEQVGEPVSRLTTVHTAPLFRDFVTLSKLLQEAGRGNEVACLKALRKSAEDRVEKFERFTALGPTGPESCKADANTQL